MTITRFLFITLLEWAAMLALKFFYFRDALGSEAVGYYIYFLLAAFVTLVLVRRLGTISYLEAIFICALWLVLFVFLDLLITSAFLGTDIFKEWQLWVGYFAMLFVVFFMHKKRHIQVRKDIHARHHGHH
jgi:hypothetical protein